MSIEGLGERIANPPARGWGLRKAQVLSFSISADPTAGSTCTVLLDGAGDPVPGVGYLAAYAPTALDWVWLLTTPGLWLILGKQA